MIPVLHIACKVINVIVGEKYRIFLLGIDEIMDLAMKELAQKAYLRNLKKILKSRPYGKNIVISISMWAALLLRYGASLI